MSPKGLHYEHIYNVIPYLMRAHTVPNHVCMFDWYGDVIAYIKCSYEIDTSTSWHI